jgi:hypothetical protein
MLIPAFPLRSPRRRRTNHLVETTTGSRLYEYGDHWLVRRREWLDACPQRETDWVEADRERGTRSSGSLDLWVRRGED